MIISYSELLTWDTCKKQYYYGFVKQLKAVEESEALTTGIRGHRLLQTFYTFLREGESLESAHKKTTASAANLLNDHKFDIPLVKAWALVDNYIREFVANKSIEIVENRYLLPVASLVDTENTWPWLADVQVGFTPDVVFKRQGDFYDVEDAKFVGKAWSESKLNHFNQAKLYTIFLRKMGYNVSRSMVRFFNTQTHQIKAVQAVIQPGEEELLINDFVAAISDVVAFRLLNDTTKNLMARRTMNFNSCQFCFFNFPCMLERQGKPKDADRAFKSQYEKRTYDYNI